MAPLTLPFLLWLLLFISYSVYFQSLLALFLALKKRGEKCPAGIFQLEKWGVGLSHPFGRASLERKVKTKKKNQSHLLYARKEEKYSLFLKRNVTRYDIPVFEHYTYRRKEVNNTFFSKLYHTCNCMCAPANRYQTSRKT